MAYVKRGPFQDGTGNPATLPVGAPPVNAVFLTGLDNAAASADADITRLKTRLAETWFNVKDYGAIGDGTTNDTAAVQAAVTAALTATNPINVEAPIANGLSPTLYFPLGTYNVDQITVAGTINIIGCEGGIYAASVLQQRADGENILFLTADTDGQSNCTVIENMTFKSRTSTSNGTAAQIKTDPNIGGANSIYIRNCWFKTPEMFSIWYTRGGDIQITGSTFDVSAFGSIKLGDFSSGAQAGSCRILNNTFFDISTNCIEISYASDVIIGDNTVGWDSSHPNSKFLLISGGPSYRIAAHHNCVNNIGYFVDIYANTTVGVVTIDHNLATVTTCFLKVEGAGTMYNLNVVGNAISSPAALPNGAFYAPSTTGIQTSVISHNTVIAGSVSPRLFDMSGAGVTSNIFNQNANSGFSANNNFANTTANGA